MKECARCKIIKDINEYYISSVGVPDGYCKECRMEYSKEYEINNKERLQEYRKKYMVTYNDEHKEERKEKRKEYNKEYNKRYKEKNAEHLKEYRKLYYREYRKKNKEKIKSIIKKSQEKKKKETMGKVCKTCGIDKPLELFSYNERYIDNHKSTCKECVKINSLKYYYNNKEHYATAYRNKNFTPEQIEQKNKAIIDRITKNRKKEDELKRQDDLFDSIKDKFDEIIFLKK